jgi:hypothetical protein
MIHPIVKYGDPVLETTGQNALKNSTRTGKA